MQGRAGGDSDGDAFFFCEQLGRRESIVSLCLEDLVIYLRVQDIRDKTGADTLDLVRARLSLGEDRRIRRFESHDFDSGVLRLQILASAGQGPAGADACDKDIHLPVGVVPDLGTCGGLVDRGVGGVHKLSGDEAAGNLRRQFLCLRDGALHSLRSLCEHDLCAVGFQDVPALHAHRLGHCQNDPVALGGGNGGEADARVAGGRLNDHRTLFQESLLFRVFDHGLGDPVLDASRGIKIL